MSDEITFKQYSDAVQRCLEQFIQDMKDLGQTEVAACGPGYEISFKIEKKEPQ